MDNDTAASNTQERGATVAITHRVRDAEHATYEAWWDRIGPVCRRATTDDFYI